MFDEFDRERRRIEAALHDGVQQDLVAVSVTLQLALQLLESDQAAARRLLVELDEQVCGALERVRALAHEIYPSLLEARGLADALRVRGIEVDAIGRHRREVEEAVYFVCRALAAAGAQIRVWEEGGAVRVDAEGAFEEPILAHARLRALSVGGQLRPSAGGAGVSVSVPTASSAR